ncbi:MULTISPECIES: methyl-accepting chemotaxis protein [Pseudomonas]|uniref:Methyl-accepting chemotaxis protein n=1 Tax=Pseudomonas quercus TaxID=2722792 RepID=A0ABX0YA57_9PSED|nr:MULTISPECIES: methyl-accepting chemotaxis protein [Pseudomonas]MBF7141288.1 methyl-accepting chemotaxis protein [Pseudomonas sp. LY10J]NJO99821.1 methyl-accepting chemotaxis protein [Pseudomonas quercus]
MFLRKVRIAQRSLLCFGFFAVLILGFGLFSLGQVSAIRASQKVLQTNVLPSVQAIDQARNDLIAIRLYNGSLRMAKDSASAATAEDRVQKARNDLNNSLDLLNPLLVSEKGKATYASLRQAVQAYLDVHNRYLAAVRAGDESTILALTNSTGEMTQAADKVQELIQTLNELIDGKVKREDGNATAAYEQAKDVTIIVVLLALAATIALAVLFTRSLVAPIGRALGVAERIANNDFSQAVAPDGTDEPGRLLAALGQMQANLRRTLTELSDSSNQLASTSEEMAAVTDDALRGIQRQNDEIAQSATAMNQMSAAVDEVANNAVLASEAARTSSTAAEQGHAQVEQTVNSINDLQGSVDRAAGELDSLADQVRSIGGVLEVIRGVADQTNLLALNAAIEAARAGEAGRGFAVVADEVRALAHRTQQSTAQIEDMVVAIQAGTDKAVSSMAESSERARVSVEVAQAAGAALEDITSAIAQINARNLNIASATEEQAQVAREVDRSLVSIRDLSAQTAAGAEQTAAAGNDLSRLAVALNGTVMRFKL